MIGNYEGHFTYSGLSVGLLAPTTQGVYYCGAKNSNNQLVPLYICRFTSVRLRN